MPVLDSKGVMILSQDSHKHSAVYRGILEMLARFGYCSGQEIMYGFDLDYKRSENRLAYLQKLGLIRGFPSGTVPPKFYCLTTHGRQAVTAFRISDENHRFFPSDYRLVESDHHRA